jgi:hypothetical protein
MQNKTGHDWQKSDLEHVRDLLTKGHSRSRIASLLSGILGKPFTKGQIAGVIERYRLAGLMPVFARPAMPKAPVRSRAVVITKRKSRLVPVMPARQSASPIHDYATCKWIDGDPRETYTVCGQPAAINAQGNPRPYCPHHCSIAYVPNVRRVEPVKEGSVG